MKFRIAWWTTSSWLVASIPSFLERRTPTPIANAFHVTPPMNRGGTKLVYHGSSFVLQAKPKQGKVVDSYQTVSIYCSKCNLGLFRYKKKNGTKSNLVKCYVERITEDSAGILAQHQASGLAMDDSYSWQCPNCQTQFARSSMIHGLPALKMVGGKVRMAKK